MSTSEKPCNILIMDCKIYGNDYSGDAISISMQGSCLSTKIIDMTLIPDQQKVVREFLMKDVIAELERQKLESDEESKKSYNCIDRTSMRYNGISEGLEEAINLIKNGVKKNER